MQNRKPKNEYKTKKKKKRNIKTQIIFVFI